MDEAQEEFEGTFMYKHQESAHPDWCTWPEFKDYYGDVSATIQSDEYFEKLITQTWSLDKKLENENREREPPKEAFNPRPRNHGAVYFSGQENNDNTLLPSTRYYQNRTSPQRKSIAYSPPRRDGFPFKETTNQSSADFSLHNNNEAFEKHVRATQQEQSFARQSPTRSGFHSQKELLLKKVRTSLNTRGVRAYISLKRQFVLADQEHSGFLTLNQWLTAFDDLKVANLQSGDLKMLFGIFDLERKC
jgi:hypothetical protein